MNDPSLPVKRLMRRAFDRAAQRYDGAAVLQRRVGVTLAARLGAVPERIGCILDAGSGTGHGTGLLRERYPAAWLLQLDIAFSMIAVGRDNQPNAAVVCADVERLPLAGARFDLVWCNLALQWVEELRRALMEMQRVLKPGGLLAFSTLGPDTLQELGRAFDGVDAFRHLNRFLSGSEVDALLRACGYVDVSVEREPNVMGYGRVSELMRDLKAIGAHNVTRGRPGGLMGKTKWQRVEANYERFRRDGMLPATYEVIYVSARKSEGPAR